eukprot:TRINITY_DN5556_c0_g1_i9.p2 TRINITY_DN5556_c0_g1~~TRINITY_DN5556_c0_g1_i9.p2  ORF type:complete len:253 (+),score=-13.71 TRINITY_DN5556_c0_g1_i9:138-896(+)
MCNIYPSLFTTSFLFFFLYIPLPCVIYTCIMQVQYVKFSAKGQVEKCNFFKKVQQPEVIQSYKYFIPMRNINCFEKFYIYLNFGYFLILLARYQYLSQNFCLLCSHQTSFQLVQRQNCKFKFVFNFKLGQFELQLLLLNLIIIYKLIKLLQDLTVKIVCQLTNNIFQLLNQSVFLILLYQNQFLVVQPQMFSSRLYLHKGARTNFVQSKKNINILPAEIQFQAQVPASFNNIRNLIQINQQPEISIKYEIQE